MIYRLHMGTFKNAIKTSLKAVLPPQAFAKLKSFVIPDEYLYFSGGWKGKVQFNEDGMATAHNADFIHSEKFKAAYEAGDATESWGPKGRPPLRWRVHHACTLAQYATRLPGDFVECGTNRGGTAAAIIEYTKLNSTNKNFYLLDTFAGFDPAVLTATEGAKVASLDARYVDSFEFVKSLFAKFPFVKLVRGTVPSTLAQVPSEQIAFLHLDMNCSGPERAAIEFFWDRIVPGGVILLDDYGWESHEEQKATMDEFAATKGLDITTLPTGQGLLLKPYR